VRQSTLLNRPLVQDFGGSRIKRLSKRQFYDSYITLSTDMNPLVFLFLTLIPKAALSKSDWAIPGFPKQLSPSGRENFADGLQLALNKIKLLWSISLKRRSL